MLSGQESIELIQQMINKAKGSYHDTGIGPILWGSVIAICSVVSYAELQYGFSLPFDVWIFTLIAIVPQVFITIRERNMRRVLKYEDKTLSYIWITFGVSIFLLIHINANVYSELNPVMAEYKQLKGADSGFRFSSYSTALMMLLYGIPSVLTGGIMHLKSMLYGGILCWLCCIVSVYTSTSTDLLLMAVSAIAMWLIPGLILRKKYGATKNALNV